MKPIISIVVPVYNVEKYLYNCIDSILKQTFTDFELILVDDGSTDSSGLICDTYAKKDCRICVVHQNNSGVSIARNTGLDSAKGQYVTFCDSDDIVENNWLESLYNGVVSTGAMFSVCGFKTSLRDGTILAEQSMQENCKCMDTFYILSNHKLLNSVCNKLFSLKIIKDNKLSFRLNINYAEDAIFVLSYIGCLGASDKYYITNQTPYMYYREAQEKTLSKSYSISHLEGEKITYKLTIDLLNKFCCDNDIIQQKDKRFLCEIIAMQIRNVFYENKSSLFAQIRQIRKIIKSDYYKKLLKYSSLSDRYGLRYATILKSKCAFIIWLYNKMSLNKNEE